MTVLSLKNICKSFGVDEILHDVSFSLNQKACLGLVGPNGTGKTTLLRIISGEIEHDGGTVSIPSGLRVGYLQQEVGIAAETTVWETMLSVFEHVFELEERMRNLEHEMEEAAADEAKWGKISEEYERVTREFEDAGGWGYESAIKGVLKGLGLGEETYCQQANTLSGGQRSRLGLAQLLLEKPDLLLLDEPTNHLDTEAIAWLEGYLKTWQGAVIIVSHDRWFLDQLCSQIVELYNGSGDVYQGNYTSFIGQRDEKREQMIKAYEMNQREIGRQKQMIERYKVWGRIGGGKNFIKAKAKEKMLEKMERMDRPEGERAKISLKLDSGYRGGNDVLTAEDLGMGFDGAPLFSHLDIALKKGDKAALIGANGIGKTTLLRIIASRLKPTGGSVQLGTGIQVSYYDQMQENLNPNWTLMEQMREAFPKMDDGEIRNTLAAVLFYGDDVFKKISSLSGGEKGRLSLVMLMLGQGNLLLLDEPTNHLDMDSREILENAICEYDGTVLFVSHDRYFINKIANRVLEMKSDGVMQYSGNWSDYLDFLEKQKTADEQTDVTLTKTEMAKQKRAKRDEEIREREAKKRIKKLEEDIAVLEEKLEEIERTLADPSSLDEEGLHALAGEHADVQVQIDKLMEEWEMEQV